MKNSKAGKAGGNNQPNAANKQAAAEKQAVRPAKKAERETVAPATSNSFLSKISFEEKICLGLLLCIVLLVVLIRSNFLTIPFERDEGAYSYYGKLLMQGKIPYKDFYEQKFPGIFYLYGFMITVFGDTVSSMHMGFIFLNVATIITLYFAAKKLFTPVAGIITAATYAITSLDPYLSGFTVQSEHGVAFFFSLGILYYAIQLKSPKWYNVFLMGLFLGCAFMIKTNGLFLVLWGGLMLVINFFIDRKKSVKEFFATVGLYSAGVFSIIIVLFLAILAKGSFKEMIFWSYTIPKQYVGKISSEMGMMMFKYTLNTITQDYMFFWIHSFLAVIVCFLPTINLKTKIFTITLLFFSFLTIVPGLYFYGHYWIQPLPGLAIAGGVTYYGIVRLFEERFNIKFKGLKYVYLTVFGLFLFGHVSAMKSYYFEPDYNNILRAVYGNNPFPETWEIAEFINANSKPEDGVVCVGSEPELYFYTKKKCPSRHAYFSALVNDVPEHRQWQREFAADVEKAKPRFFVFYNHNISLLVQPHTDTFIFDWMKQYINANYKMVGMVDMIDGQPSVYKWKDQINNYKPQGKNIIYVFELKS